MAHMTAKRSVKRRALSKASRIYLDFASATPLLPSVLREMHAAEALIGNPGSIHAEGVAAARVLERARDRVAAELGCKARQIIFTSGLTESNNLAILGYGRKLTLAGVSLSGTHWITSSIEHDSVLECFGEIERLGGRVTFVDPNKGGIVTPESIANALRADTVFVSVGWANNEIGTVAPLSKIASAIRAFEHSHPGGAANGKRIIFHSDAGQAPLYLSPQVHTLGVNMLSLGAGKLYGPRTSGALFVRDPLSIAPMIVGGGQEKGLRAGTEKVAAAVGCAKALEVLRRERVEETKRLRDLRDHFVRNLAMYIPGMYMNGDVRHALPHMLNISIPGERTGEYLVLQLDHAGISVSTKSACRSGEAKSHVVAALASLGGEEWRATNTIRFSLGRSTTKRDLARALSALKQLFPR